MINFLVNFGQIWGVVAIFAIAFGIIISIIWGCVTFADIIYQKLNPGTLYEWIICIGVSAFLLITTVSLILAVLHFLT